MKRLYLFRFVTSIFIIASVFFVFIFSNKDIKTFKSTSVEIRTKNVQLILDAGHGGEDGGAVSVTGTFESKLNIDIVKKCEQLAAFYGFCPVLTRESDLIEYPSDASTTHARKVADQKQRVKLINSHENAVLISVHQNKYTSGGPHGAQVFFSKNTGSQELAQYIQQIFIDKIDSSNKRSASKISDSIYLMKSVDCTAVLVECGFISNENEAYLLEDSSYQTKIASVIIGGMLTWYDSNGQFLGGTYEG